MDRARYKNRKYRTKKKKIQREVDMKMAYNSFLYQSTHGNNTAYTGDNFNIAKSKSITDPFKSVAGLSENEVSSALLLNNSTNKFQLTQSSNKPPS